LKKIIITGANGLLGQKLIELLQSEAYKEKFESIFTSREAKGTNPEQNYTSLDITQRDTIEQLIEKEKPQALINCAAMTQVDACETEKELCWKINTEAVEYLAQACAKHNVFLLHISTDFIFDGKNGPYKETDFPNPISHYGQSKLASEQFLESKRNLHWAIARTILVLGYAKTLSRSNIVLWVKNSLEDGKTINVVNDQWRTPTLAEDLAQGCMLIVEKEAEGVFNIAGRDMLTPYDIALKTAEVFELDKGLINETDGSKFQQTAKRPPKTGLIIDKAVKELSYNPRSFEESLKIIKQQLEN